MIYILKNIGKGFIGKDHRSINGADLLIINEIPALTTRVKDVVMAAGNWFENPDTLLYEYNISNPAIKVDTEVDLIPKNESISAVIAAEISPYTPISDGEVKVIAKYAPMEDIIVNLIINQVTDV